MKVVREVLGERRVEERVEGIAAPFAREVADGAADPLGVASARATFTASQVNTKARPSVSASAARQALAHRGIAEQRLAPVTGGEHLAERGHLVEEERVVQSEEHLHLLQRRLRVHAVARALRATSTNSMPALPTVAQERERARSG